MKMTCMEKRFVNHKRKSERNIKKLEWALQVIDLKKVKTVLELGCGIGFVSRYLAETYHWKVYGTDYDDEQIQLANERQPKMDSLTYQVEDAAKLSFEDSSIDLVLSQDVFHHIPNWETAVKEIARVLRSGGYFLWSDLTFPGIVKTIFHPFVKNYGLYTIADIEQAFEFQGFKILFHECLIHGPFSQYHYIWQHH